MAIIVGEKNPKNLLFKRLGFIPNCTHLPCTNCLVLAFTETLEECPLLAFIDAKRATPLKLLHGKPKNLKERMKKMMELFK